MDRGDNWSVGSSGPKREEEEENVSKCQEFKKHALLPLLFLIAMICGVSIGFIIRAVDPSFTGDERRIMYLAFPGSLMIAMLKEIILPLVVTSLIAGVGALPGKSAGKLGWRMILYYMATTLIAVIIGIVYVTSIQPGNRGSNIDPGPDRGTGRNPWDSLLDLIRNLFPSNLIEACFDQISTVVTMSGILMMTVNVTNITGTMQETMTEDQLEEYQSMMTDNGTEPDVNITIVDSYTVYSESISQTMSGGTNTLGIIVFSVAFGIMISRLGERGLPLLRIFTLMQDVVINIVRVVIWYCPIGITFLLASKIVEMENPRVSFTQLAYYMATVILGLATHFFIVLPLIYFVFTRKNPFKLMGNMSPALMLAVSTASSSATMSVTMKSLRERAGVNPLISNFMVPVGATINMDGTALYEAVASIFIAQYNNIYLDFGQIIIVAITATAAAIGAAGVPEAGLVTMMIVLQAVGLPTEDVALIYAVDWFLDRLRTTLNVWGDSVGAATVAHRLRHDLEKTDDEELGATANGHRPPPYNYYDTNKQNNETTVVRF